MKTNYESFEDIVFENRNKAYGAYELRQQYSKRGTFAMVIAISILLLAFGGPLIANIMGNRPLPIIVNPGGPITLEPPIVEKPKLPTLPKQENTNNFKYHPPRIVETVKNDEEFLTNDDLALTSNLNIKDTASAVSGSGIGPIVEDPKPIVEIVYETYAIQEKPKFGDGDISLIKYLSEHTVYPIPAQEQGIEGTVYIRFVVTKTGDVDKASVMRGVDPLLDDEALRVVSSIPKWTPGKNNGSPVSVWFIIPVRFQLK